jgi:hypothetical protein
MPDRAVRGGLGALLAVMCAALALVITQPSWARKDIYGTSFAAAVATASIAA